MSSRALIADCGLAAHFLTEPLVFTTFEFDQFFDWALASRINSRSIRLCGRCTGYDKEAGYNSHDKSQPNHTVLLRDEPTRESRLPQPERLWQCLRESTLPPELHRRRCRYFCNPEAGPSVRNKSHMSRAHGFARTAGTTGFRCPLRRACKGAFVLPSVCCYAVSGSSGHACFG